MNTFIIRRRNAWNTAADLEKAAGRSSRVGNEEMADRVRWIRSYITEEADGTLGSVCVYEAVDPNAIYEHAERAEMRCDEVVPVARTVVIREDPSQAA